ncbi:MAG TPA: formylglycine-generating enzyme family protein [Longimicrobiales bacterium]|nr:formylglycine-generating enzyme family protein [Longimicrobiales bacterium]
MRADAPIRGRFRPSAGALLTATVGTCGALVLTAALVSGASAQAPGDLRSVDVPGVGVRLELAFIPAGTRRMGSPETEAGRDPDEGPMHEVTVSPFWMTVHEITADQYAPFRYETFDDDTGPQGPGTFDVDAVSRPSPPYEDPGHGMAKEDHPATGMTRMNALYYARWLSEKTGRLFRLPTEAEWEYACRAGGDGPWGRGTEGTGDPAAPDGTAWYAETSGGSHHPVGGLAPNAWGLHDMHGNVAEWVMDGYREDAYGRDEAALPVADPREGDAWRGRGVVRGGAFDDPAERLRCAERFPETPAWKRRDPQIPKSRWWNTDSPHVGFRLVSPAGDLTPAEIRAWWEDVLGAGGDGP